VDVACTVAVSDVLRESVASAGDVVDVACAVATSDVLRESVASAVCAAVVVACAVDTSDDTTTS